MQKHLIRSGVVAVVFLTAACLTDPRALLFVSIRAPNPIPDTTALTEITFNGAITRSPQREGRIMRISVEGGADTVSKLTDSFGNFSIRVRLHRDTLNVMTFTPSDDDEKTVPQPITIRIVQVRDDPDSMPAPAPLRW